MPSSPITSTEANFLIGINIVSLVISLIVFIWALYKLLFTRHFRETSEKKFTEFFTTTEGIYSPQIYAPVERRYTQAKTPIPTPGKQSVRIAQTQPQYQRITTTR